MPTLTKFRNSITAFVTQSLSRSMDRDISIRKTNQLVSRFPCNKEVDPAYDREQFSGEIDRHNCGNTEYTIGGNSGD